MSWSKLNEARRIYSLVDQSWLLGTSYWLDPCYRNVYVLYVEPCEMWLPPAQFWSARRSRARSYVASRRSSLRENKRTSLSWQAEQTRNLRKTGKPVCSSPAPCTLLDKKQHNSLQEPPEKHRNSKSLLSRTPIKNKKNGDRMFSRRQSSAKPKTPNNGTPIDYTV